MATTTMPPAPDLGFLLESLTLDEKLQLIAGQSQWRTAKIDRLGIPSLKVSMESLPQLSPKIFWLSNP